MRSMQFILGVLVLAWISAGGVAAQPGSGPQAKPFKNPSRELSDQAQTDGARIFEHTCSRCHTAPNGFSPRISGTVLRHMRVRASLSQGDEEQLLHFLNP
jgi:cytochrome c5